ncbi:MAG: hypothetical protein ACKOCH_27605, partial [Bacteroidota bacterium]
RTLFFQLLISGAFPKAPFCGFGSTWVNPRPTPSCFSDSFQAAFPEAAFRRLGSTWSAAINLVLFNRRGTQR